MIQEKVGGQYRVLYRDGERIMMRLLDPMKNVTIEHDVSDMASAQIYMVLDCEEAEGAQAIAESYRGGGIEGD